MKLASVTIQNLFFLLSQKNTCKQLVLDFKYKAWHSVIFLF